MRFGACMALVLLMSASGAAAQCAHDVAGLRLLARDASFPVRWIESGMDDGRPLVLSLADTERGLHLRFDKTDEGLWVEGVGSVCTVGDALEIRFAPGHLRPGAAAHWLLRAALQAGGQFTLTREKADELRVHSASWTGRFVGAGPR
ncbi:MAG: hypothetical protein K0R58_2467 [Ramlibacter sp.]|jgi:hypothetical protein|nr:hypothetical protein [Ramlibacter sp.]